jgi:hypothetical protein
VNVLNRGEHIKDSPFVVMIDPERAEKTAQKARVMPADSEVDDIRVGEPFEFFVECELLIPNNLSFLASKPADIKVYDPELTLVDRVRRTPTSRQLANGVQQQKVSFVPYKAGKYVICAAEDKIAIDDTPFSASLTTCVVKCDNKVFQIEVSKAVDISKLHVYGPGVGANVYSTQTTSFAIDARDVGCKKIDVEIVDPSGQTIEAEIKQESGQPISVSYTPNRAGPYKVSLLFKH